MGIPSSLADDLPEKGDFLSIEKLNRGWRGYLCIAGGIDVPPVLGSKSTYTLGGLGGIRGRTLKKGDLVPVGIPRSSLDSLKGRKVRESVLPETGSAKELRVILGPQDDHVKDESIKVFLNTHYQVSIRSNRVGYRFEALNSSLRRDLSLGMQVLIHRILWMMGMPLGPSKSLQEGTDLFRVLTV
jgi:allophanate hydrolase subunit 2